MKLPRRKFLHLAASAVALPAVPRHAQAQAYPTRPVRILVGFAPGGASDNVARLMGQWLSERLGQPFVIENRLGGSGSIATEAVARAAPDGHTLALTGQNDAINAILYNNLKFDFIRDFAPIATLIRQPLVMVVHPSVPAKTVPEFITYAKANPGKMSVASAGIGTPPHLAGEFFKMVAGVDLIHVPYRGGAPAVTDLIGGQVQVLFISALLSSAHIAAGKLRALAVSATTRLEALPDIPTVSDFFPGFEASFWAGIAAPRNTSTEVVDKLNKEINAALDDPKIKARFADMAATALGGSPADYQTFLADETEKWAKVIKFAGIKAQ